MIRGRELLQIVDALEPLDTEAAKQTQIDCSTTPSF